MLKNNRTRFECLHQWFKDHPEEATIIARDAVWGLYGEQANSMPDEPEEREFPSGSDYQSYVDEAIANCGMLTVLKNLRKARSYNKHFPAVTHWIVSGRIPYDDEDSTLHVVVAEDSSPAHEFALKMYETSELELPENYADDETKEWIYINAEIEIHGPPVNRHRC